MPSFPSSISARRAQQPAPPKVQPNGERAPTATLKQIGDHIGGRIRQRRTELGLTQEQLGDMLGVSYQQIQKYETAANRVSASRLYELARACGVDVSYFFEELEDHHAPGVLPHGGHNRASIDLVRNFMAIKDDGLRGAVSGLLKALRERDGEAGAQSEATSA
jgi:transcriptional regulator with XRE-family HTH domain